MYFECPCPRVVGNIARHVARHTNRSQRLTDCQVTTRTLIYPAKLSEHFYLHLIPPTSSPTSSAIVSENLILSEYFIGKNSRFMNLVGRNMSQKLKGWIENKEFADYSGGKSLIHSPVFSNRSWSTSTSSQYLFGKKNRLKNEWALPYDQNFGRLNFRRTTFLPIFSTLKLRRFHHLHPNQIFTNHFISFPAHCFFSWLKIRPTILYSNSWRLLT